MNRMTMTVFHILFWFLRDQQRIKKVKMVDTLSTCRYPVYFCCKDRTARSSTVVYRLINNGSFVLCIYRLKAIECCFIHFIFLLTSLYRSGDPIFRLHIFFVQQDCGTNPELFFAHGNVTFQSSWPSIPQQCN